MFVCLFVCCLSPPSLLTSNNLAFASATESSNIRPATFGKLCAWFNHRELKMNGGKGEFTSVMSNNIIRQATLVKVVFLFEPSQFQFKIEILQLKWDKTKAYFFYRSKCKVIYPKYSKHWLSTVARTIDCVCSKILNHGLNHGLLFSLFKFFGWKNIVN